MVLLRDTGTQLIHLELENIVINSNKQRILEKRIDLKNWNAQDSVLGKTVEKANITKNNYAKLKKK